MMNLITLENDDHPIGWEQYQLIDRGTYSTVIDKVWLNTEHVIFGRVKSIVWDQIWDAVSDAVIR